MPFSFVENRGQADSRVRVIGNGPRFKGWFDERGVVLQQGGATMRLDFEAGHPQPRITLVNPIGATASYLRGNDATRWQTNLPLFGAVQYDGVWPGVGITFRQDKSRVKAEYTLAAGADVDEIRLRFDGEVAVEGDGGLRVLSSSGEFREDKPILYQDLPSGRVVVPGRFVRSSDGAIGFSAEYDHTRALVIDPSIYFSGYFGGTSQDTITSVAVSSTFNVIVAGYTSSSDLPASGGAKTSNGGGVDAFVASFEPVHGQLVACSYLGGSGDDRAFGVAVDSSNNIYLTGWASSANFPVAGAFQTHLSGTRDAFVAKLNPAGSALIYSTFLGGSGVDAGYAIAVDSTGQAVITGDTTSTNLPVTVGAFQGTLHGGQDVFVARLAPNGASLSFLTYFGGSGADHGAAVKVDSGGPIVIGGSTTSFNLPLLLPFQPHLGGGQDGFVAKFNSSATGLVFSTYIGGSGGTPGMPEAVNGIVIGTSHNIVVAGTTSSVNFPVTSKAAQQVYGGGQTDGFISKFNSTSGSLLVSTFLGGSLNDGINALTMDQNARIYVTGFTTSTDFPVHYPTQNASAGGVAGSMDAFVVGFDTAVSTMFFGTYLGGGGSDSGNAIVVDPMTCIIVAGQTASGDFPVAGSLGNYMTESLSSFVTRFAPNWRIAVSQMPSIYVDASHTANSLNASSVNAGQPGDIPVVGDWNGTGVRTIGVFRSGTWILDTNGSGTLDGSDKTVAFGQAGDIPVLGDWNGTGTIKLGLYRAGTFILDLSGHLSGVPTGQSDATFLFGLSTDIPVVGDWNATGTSKVGVFRQGSWLIDYNGDHIFDGNDRSYVYGQAGDIPVVGDWDSSGLSRIGVYRSGYWILNYSGSNAMGTLGQTDLYFFYGGGGMKPLLWQPVSSAAGAAAPLTMSR